MHLIFTATNPCPPQAIDGFFKTEDGINIRFARWVDTLHKSKGTICILAGRGEFIEKYFEIIEELRKRNFSVAIFDWRDQGGSDRNFKDLKKGHVKTFKKYDLDLQDFMRDIVLPHCPPPYIAIGHSMGATILLRNLAKKDTPFSRAILTAPLLGLKKLEGKYKQKILTLSVEILCLLGFSRFCVPSMHTKTLRMDSFDNNKLTSDFTRWKRTKDIVDVASHLKIGPPTFGWTRAALRTFYTLHTRKFSKKISTPILMFVAGSDSIVSTQACEKFSQLVKNCKLIYLNGSHHEALQEKDLIRMRFWAAFDGYLGL